MGAADLDLLASAAYLLGRERGNDADDPPAHSTLARGWLSLATAARRASWLGIVVMLRGEEFAHCVVRRGGQLLDGIGGDPEPGAWLAAGARRSCGWGAVRSRGAVALQRGCRAADASATRTWLGGLCRGQALIGWGGSRGNVTRRRDGGCDRREVSAELSGILYCAVIQECHPVFDLRGPGSGRRRWTAGATAAGLMPYRGSAWCTGRVMRSRAPGRSR